MGKGRIDFRGLIIMTIDVSSDARPCQEFHVVAATQESNVIDLWNSRRKELKRASNQVLCFAAAKRIKEGAVHLIEIQVVGCRSRCLLALPIASLVDCLHQIVNLRRRQESRISV